MGQCQISGSVLVACGGIMVKSCLLVYGDGNGVAGNSVNSLQCLWYW